MRLLSVLSIPILLATAPQLGASPGNVWTVAAAGADFTQIQPAVDGAADGDLILVKPGSYAQFAIVDRSLTVVAESPGSVSVTGPVRVADLAPSRRVTLIDLSATAPSSQAATFALSVKDCQGSVRVRGGTWKTSTPLYGTTFSVDVTAVRVEGCADVALNGVVCQGANGYSAIDQFYGPTSGGGGLRVVDSALAAFHSQFLGGKGGSGDEGEGGAGGGLGLDVQGQFVHLASIEAKGGSGGSGGAEKNSLFFENAGNGGPGGHGVRLLGPVSAPGIFVNLLALAADGGLGGAGGPGFLGPNGSPGAPGQPVTVSGTVLQTSLAGPVKRLVTPGLWRTGIPTPIQFIGSPGDQVWLAVSPQPGFTRVSSKQGVLLLGGKPSIQPKGSITGGNSLGVTVTPSLPAGWEGRVLHLQAWLTQPDGTSVLTAVCPVAIVDAAL